jgi:hypothetical protein
MSMSDADEMRSTIAGVIGRDAVYINATDNVRHLTSNPEVWVYVGNLLFGFANAGGLWLWNTLKKKWQEAGERAIGDALNAALEKVKKTASHKSEMKATESETKVLLQEQTQQLNIASQALRELGTAAEPKDIESFLAGGEAAVMKQLIDDSFPEAKARRIAAALTLQVEMRIKGGKRA